jgi:hypothetical protein
MSRKERHKALAEAIEQSVLFALRRLDYSTPNLDASSVPPPPTLSEPHQKFYHAIP